MGMGNELSERFKRDYIHVSDEDIEKRVEAFQAILRERKEQREARKEMARAGRAAPVDNSRGYPLVMAFCFTWKEVLRARSREDFERELERKLAMARRDALCHWTAEIEPRIRFLQETGFPMGEKDGDDG